MEAIRILLVTRSDGQGRIASILKQEYERFTVRTTTTASEGLNRLAETSFDCIVSAYELPDQNGIELLKAVRTEYPDLPFILYTGNGSEEVASKAISAGVTDYLIMQPGAVAELTSRITAVVAEKQGNHRASIPDYSLKELVETTNDVFWMYTRDWGELLFINSAYEEMWGQSIERLRENPQDFLNAIHPDDRRQVKEAMEAAAGGKPTEIECRVNPNVDYRRWVWIQMEPVTDETGKVQRIAGFTRDITDRKAYEQSIEDLHTTVRQSIQARTAEDVAEVVVTAFDDILDMPVNALWLHDEQENALEPTAWTDRATNVVGIPPTFYAGDGIAWEVFETGETRYCDDVTAIPDRYNPETDIRSEILLPLGEYGLIIAGSTEVSAFDPVDVSLARTLAAHTEATLDRITHEQDLRDEREFIDQALDALNDIFYVIGTDGEFRRWNDQLSEITGYTAAEIDEMQATDFFPEDEQQRIAKAIELTSATGKATIEADLLTADRNRIPYEFTGARLTDVEGNVIGLVGVGRNITEHKEYEQELKRKNERLEEFTGIVSHDLRNPLQVAQGRLEVLQDELDHDQLDVIANAHQRMHQLIDDLLMIAKKGEQSVDIEDVDLNSVLEDCWKYIRTAEATLLSDVDSTIRADRGKLKQLVENLIQNAVEHGSENVKIEVGRLERGFYIADDGPGISADVRERVFERGYSNSNAGNGLGLAIVAQVADLHGWEVTVVESNHGGARFEITGVEFVSG